jgi:hypothetical protein
MILAMVYQGSSKDLINQITTTVTKWLPLLVWPLIVCLPLFFTYKNNYRSYFPVSWYNEAPPSSSAFTSAWPSPLGLSLGIIAVIIGQIATLIYFISFKFGYFNDSSTHPLSPVQKCGAPEYKLKEALFDHLAQPEGFLLLGAYLIIYWMSGKMPPSYYSFEGGISWTQVFLQLLIQDFTQAVMHWLEHKVSAEFYKRSHKPHHFFTNPKFFDAFNGSFFDTLFMVLVPLFITSRCIHVNVWTYMTFGSLFANWLTLIHSEYHHLWDKGFKILQFGTAGDHHVHHKLFKYNYGHLFM